MDVNDLHLLADAKDNKTFHSARWGTDTNPDLCFVSQDPASKRPIPAMRKVLNKFPHSQHKPSLITVGIVIPIIKTAQLPRWNFRKANWSLYGDEVDKNIQSVPPTTNNYRTFVDIIHNAAKISIPRGYRRQYIPCWSPEIEQLYRRYTDTGESAIADELLMMLDKARGDRWRETTGDLDFTHSSRRGWSLLRRLGAASAPPEKNSAIDVNQIATRLQNISSNPKTIDKSFRREINSSVKENFHSLPENSEWSEPFTVDEISIALKKMKLRKAPGLDNVFPEFLRNLKHGAKTWLAQFYTNILQTGNIPNLFRKSKILAILKPGKPPDSASSYRPIALLSMCYKLLERLIHNRLYPTIDAKIIPEQAGFRSGRGCDDQMLAFTSYIEAGFQRGLKTTAAFIDLSSAYDTVWKRGMIYKLQQMIPCKKMTFLIQNMLSNRRITVFLNNSASKEKTLKNGLPQGSVLAPLLFNVYCNDLPGTKSRKFIYADDMALASQHKTLQDGSAELTSDLLLLHEYYSKWRLQPNPTKSEVAAFHLSNRLAHQELDVTFGGEKVRHNSTPTYLGITLDRALTFNNHLSKCAQKLKSRNNLLQKIAGTSWGAGADVLRTAAISLVYSTAEYGAPAWYKSKHTAKIDTQLNEAMRLVSGTIRSTPTNWLPVLANIAPPPLRRTAAAKREWDKLNQNHAVTAPMPFQRDIQQLPPTRLKSRNPIWLDKKLREPYSITVKWKEHQPEQASPHLRYLSNSIPEQPPGFNLTRKVWCRLNRFRTGHGRCRDMMFKWNLVDSPECDCGAPRQTMDHIVNVCPMRRFLGGMEELNAATPDAVRWLEELDVDV